MSALNDLHQFYDGPIPVRARSAAIEADWFATMAVPRSPVLVRVKSYKPAGIIDRMAETMRRVARLRGLCHRQDLAEAGFSTAEIDSHGENARALASRRAEASAEHRTTPDIPVTEILAARRILAMGSPQHLLQRRVSA